MAKTNAENVRAYYERNKKVVLVRKAIKRCRERGAVPNVNSMRAYDISLTALMVAFAEWAIEHIHKNGNHDLLRLKLCQLKVEKQSNKLQKMRVKLGM